MVATLNFPEIPIPEKQLREFPKSLPDVIPNFAEREQTLGVKDIHNLIGPILETANVANLTPSHRAAACNAVCAIIEYVQSSEVEWARDSLLDDFIWFRLFQIYLLRCDDAKGKSVRQILLVLTNVLLKNLSPASLQLQHRAVSVFVEKICHRHDRLKVKPALQGLAHFLLKSVVSLPELIEIYKRSLPEQRLTSCTNMDLEKSFFSSIVAWIVHHDTSLSAGHLIKNYLVQLRRSPHYQTADSDGSTLVMWIKPVVSSLRRWPDRIQEFKTHVFPHCFLPKIEEYLQFLSYLHFGRHIAVTWQLPDQIQAHKDCQNDLDIFDEFKILLAAIQTGKELGIVEDIDYRRCDTIKIYGNSIHLPDNLYEMWLSHPEPEVRLAGLFFSIYSTNVTRPITTGIFRSLKRNLIHLHTDTDANFRREVLGYTQKLFDRLRGSMSALARLEPKGSIFGHDQISISMAHSRLAKHRRIHSTQEPLRDALDFLVWYIRFLEWELRSTSSYQRRVTALRAITVVLKSGLDPRVPRHCLSRSARGEIHWRFGFQICNARLVRTLLDMMLDPFDDIRSASASILELSFDSFGADEKTSILTTLPQFLRRAESAMLRTGRADHADGLARGYSLLFSQCGDFSANLQIPDIENYTTRIGVVTGLVDQVEDTIRVAQSDMALAVDGRPVHGAFAALRYIIDQEAFYPTIAALPVVQIEEWKKLHTRICTSYQTLWSCIRDVLCADAPEGHVPEDMEEETSIDTKEILSYSWRGLKEASILLRSMVSKAPISAEEHSLLGHASFETLGKLCFTQLVDLRHRGAFSTVAQTFAAFCRRCLSTDDEVLRPLPERWYQETLLCIHDKANSITRRSAGIPALMTSIIAAEAFPGSGTLFPRAMKDLLAEASQEAHDSNIEESRLPQVHALNCIKEIFTTSSLSAASEPYLGECLSLAAKSLNSKVWPIRNCSLVLFKALIHRLLGSDEAQDWKERDRTKTSRFSYQNYPNMAGILSELLDPNGQLKGSMTTTVQGSSPLDLHGAEGVFPALQILRQAPPPEADRELIMKYVLHLVGSSHWHLRDMTARTLASLYHPHDDINTIATLLASLEAPTDSQHGLLLTLKYVVTRFLRDMRGSGSGFIHELLVLLSTASSTIFTDNNCAFIKAAFLDLVNLCGMALLQESPCFDAPTGEWEVLTNSLDKLGEDGAAGSALLRVSSTQWRAINQAITDYHPGTALLGLSRSDPDSCLTLLNTLAEIINIRSIVKSTYSNELLVQLYLQTLNGEDEEVTSKAQVVLAKSFQTLETQSWFFTTTNKDDVMRSLEQLESQCIEGSPSSMQSAVHLLGYFLDYSFNFPHHRRAVLQRIARYIRLLRRTIDEENPFDSRFAAVQSLCALFQIWELSSSSKSTTNLLLGLCIVLYDLLNDDDDEIRDVAAVAFARLFAARRHDLPTTIKPVAPILTVHRLARFLTTHFHTSRSLFSEAIRRLAGTSSVATLSSTPFAATLAEARKEDNALFSTEKRNLFKDDTLDTALWSRVLRSMSPLAVPPEHKQALISWVLDGLAALSATARSEGDGALGWTSKAEVFTLGMRVICAAEVVLGWGGEEVGQIRRSLRELVDGEGIHGLWVEKIESVLEASVLEALKRVHRSLGLK
ncbi:HEAT repeat protein-like protein [Pleomassaria siparia CBS 279.74]|uniref:HEAT repeat protein-like protein n=1 Tax=Pleomassaria siparia CBS 279.74 TaxID=1314801 RepID=A0A6G1KQP3_9PLEO|nr:HEAT repeat protein-like protein [Pleomassaria siparia CBS 279.74]